MDIVSKHCRKLIMWFLTVKDSELSLFGSVCRWGLLVSAILFVLASAYRIAWP